MPRYPVYITIKEIREDLPPKCPVHDIDDKVAVENGTIIGKICLPVLAMHLPRIYALVNGAPSPYGDVITIKCPDQGKVVYEIRRDSTKWWKDALSPLTPSEVNPQQVFGIKK